MRSSFPNRSLVIRSLVVAFAFSVLASIAVAHYIGQQQPTWTHDAEKTFDTAQRQSLYSKIQAQTAQDAFMGFLYYSPYLYANSSKTHGFFVYPTGNYHVEDVWLSH